MSSKLKKISDFIIYLFLVIIFSGLLLIVPVINLNKSDKSVFIHEKSETKINEEKIESVIKEISLDMQVISKNVIGKLYTSVLLYDEEELRYESHIYNADGIEITIENLLKEDQINNFWNKVYELLALKYPEFIVNGIKNSEGANAYELKENEMIIYFMNYKVDPEYNEIFTLKVNYNEIKEYIDFTCKLDALYNNENGFDYSKNKKSVALTFDDGPKGEKTLKLLELLEKNKAHATFFMVGTNMKADQKTVKAVYESGNEIGSHTYAHGNFNRQNYNERMEALAKVDEIYKSITGDNIELLRPPYGAYKREMLEEFDYSVILWNIDTEDWRYKDVDRIINTVLDNLSDGSVILMHDSYKTTIEAVEKLLPILYIKGYQVVSVSELAELKDIELQKNTSYRKFN